MEKPSLMKVVEGRGCSDHLQHKVELEPAPISYLSFHHQQQKDNLKVDVSAEEDTEISIFDAQRYFNESNNDTRVCKRVSPLNIHQLDRSSSEGCDLSALSRFSSASSATDGFGYGGRAYRIRSFHATPTASSEASWNSQTGLLSNPPGAITVNMNMKNTTMDDSKKESVCGSGKIKWFWSPSCPCSGKKSVQVEPKTTSNPSPKPKLLGDQKSLATINDSSWEDKREEKLIACNNPHRISAENQFQRVLARPRPLNISDGGGFTFPVLNNQQPIPKMAAGNRNNLIPVSSDVDEDDPGRESLEVFRPYDKKLMSRITIADDDVASDTSSDLFEIESFSTTTQTQNTAPYAMYYRRDSLDEVSNPSFIGRRSMIAAGTTNGLSGGFGCPYSPMVNECYEPSEASIDWSVTTAEGFERGSVGVSEAEEMISMVGGAHGGGHGHGHGGGRKSGNGGGGGLLSCRSEKAVSVGPNPVALPPQGQAMATSKHVSNMNKPPLARLPLPFAA